MADTYVNTGSNTDYASKMPEFTNDADIKKAFQAYHYGDPSLATSSSFTGEWDNPDVGILGKLLYLNDADAALDLAKINKSLFTAKGSLLSASALSTPVELAVGTNNHVLRANSATASGLEWYNLDTTHLSLNPGSQTIVGDLYVSKASAALRISATSGQSTINIDRVAGQYGIIQFRTGASSRWQMGVNSGAESGSNAGSNFSIWAIADDGTTTAFNPVQINRATGLVTLSSLTVAGTMTGSLTGNASTATTLQTARNINGVSFNGSADITVTAAASTLTGTVLNSTVVTSSLTSVGTIGTGVWQGTVVAGQYGGTGVANTGKTITLGGNLTTSGAYAVTLTATNTTNVTLPTSGTLAIVGNPLSQFASTTSAQLAGVISDETGSGNLVFHTSPALAGTPTAPTASVDTNTTQLATTAYVVGQGYLKSATASSTYAPIASPTFTGKVTTAASTAPGGAGLRLPEGTDPTTPAHGDIWTTTTDVRAYINGATVVLAQVTGGSPVVSASDINAGVLSPQFGGTGVNNGTKTLTLSGNVSIGSTTNTVTFTTSGNTSVALPTSGTLATLASPTFTGTPAAPTATAGTNTTQIATTAFVSTAVANLVNAAPAALDTLDELAAALGDDANFASTMTNALALKAPLASPTFTGTPAAPTAVADTNTTQIATTAFVIGQDYLKSSTAASTYAPLTSPTFVTSVLTSSATLSVFNTTATTINAFGAATNLTIGATTGTTTVRNGLTVTGNLIVNGTTTTINSTTMTVDDPIITLGGDTPPGSDDNKDRGVEFRYYTGGGAYTGFFGYDDSSGKFTFLTAATNTSEVFSGTKGSIDAYFSGSDINTGLVAGQYGGTGVNNNGKTITLGGNLTTSGAYALTFTLTGTTSVTLPTSGTLLSTSATTLDSLVNIDTTSTSTHTVNIATGITSSGQTKTINIGRYGANGSDTRIYIGGDYADTIKIGTDSLSGGTAFKYVVIGPQDNVNSWVRIHNGSIKIRPSEEFEYPNFVIPPAAHPATYLYEGGMWTTTVGVFMYLNSVTHQFAFLDSPTFTGTPAAPTAAVDTNTTQIATTAYVVGQGYLKSATAVSTYAPLAGPTFTGTVTLPSTTSIGTVSSTEIGYLDGVTSAVQTQIDDTQMMNMMGAY